MNIYLKYGTRMPTHLSVCPGPTALEVFLEQIPMLATRVAVPEACHEQNLVKLLHRELWKHTDHSKELVSLDKSTNRMTLVVTRGPLGYLNYGLELEMDNQFWERKGPFLKSSWDMFWQVPTDNTDRSADMYSGYKGSSNLMWLRDNSLMRGTLIDCIQNIMFVETVHGLVWHWIKISPGYMPSKELEEVMGKVCEAYDNSDVDEFYRQLALARTIRKGQSPQVPPEDNQPTKASASDTIRRYKQALEDLSKRSKPDQKYLIFIEKKIEGIMSGAEIVALVEKNPDRFFNSPSKSLFQLVPLDNLVELTV